MTIESITVNPIQLSLIGLGELTEILLLNTKTTNAHWTDTDTEKIAAEIVYFGIEKNDLNIENYGYQIHAIENVVDWYIELCQLEEDDTYYCEELSTLKPVIKEGFYDAVVSYLKGFDACLVDVDC